jgi:NAD-dependent DNA ligase
MADIANDLPKFYDVGLKGDDRLMNLEGFGAGKFKILNKATLLTSKTTLVRFLEGMDMSGFSSTRFDAILEHLGTKIELMDFVKVAMDVATISKIPGFGENTAKALSKALGEALPTIKEMLKRVAVDAWEPQKKASTRINGVSFCFTGAMTHDRTFLEKAVKMHGGIVAGVSKKLDYLVVSSMDWTSGKTQKAEALGIKKITEQDFINMIGGV